MAGKHKRARLDPELMRQLDEATAANSAVQAVVFLRSSRRAASDVAEQAGQLIETVKRKTGEEPKAVNVMRHLGTVAVEAPASFVRGLIDETDVASAVANVHPDGGEEVATMGAPSAIQPAPTERRTKPPSDDSC